MKLDISLPKDIHLNQKNNFFLLNLQKRSVKVLKDIVTNDFKKDKCYLLDVQKKSFKVLNILGLKKDVQKISSGTMFKGV